MWEHIEKYWLNYAMGLIAAGLAGLWRWVKKKARSFDAMNEASLALMHDRLYQACRFYLASATIDIEGLKNIEYLYKAYHALGGNGTGTELYERVKKLPIKEEN